MWCCLQKLSRDNQPMTLTNIQLDDVIAQYCNRVVNEMDIKSMEQMLYDMLVDSFQQSSEHEMEDLITAVYDEEYWQDLVESVTPEEVSQDSWSLIKSRLEYTRSFIFKHDQRTDALHAPSGFQRWRDP